jgi:hypothetical protein
MISRFVAADNTGSPLCFWYPLLALADVVNNAFSQHQYLLSIYIYDHPFKAAGACMPRSNSLEASLGPCLISTTLMRVLRTTESFATG